MSIPGAVGGIGTLRRSAITVYSIWYWCQETCCRKFRWALSGIDSTKERGILSMLTDFRSSGVVVLIHVQAKLCHSSHVCTYASMNLSLHHRHCMRRMCAVCP
uniref:Uncharacterized protein n=1 Tax=Eutreptiella gymnastica TaxID=73025 RepID=A0A7S1IYN0_9EUGL